MLKIRRVFFVKIDGILIAKSSNVLKVWEQYYFLESDVDWSHIVVSDRVSVCLWKGKARVLDFHGRKELSDIGWIYFQTTDGARRIENMVIFSNLVSITKPWRLIRK